VQADELGLELRELPHPGTGPVRQPGDRGVALNASRDIPNSTPHKPVCSRDGRELSYVPRLGGFEVVRVSTSPT